MADDVVSYVALQKELLDLERDAEREETLQAGSAANLATLQSSGLALTRLSLHAQSSDAGGRHVLTFRPRAANRKLSAARISAGDIVAIRPHARADRDSASTPPPALFQGVVTAFDDAAIDVVVDDDPPDEDHAHADRSYALLKLSSDVTHRRYTKALSLLADAVDDPTHVAYPLLGVLLRAREPRFRDPGPLDPALIDSLNGRQTDALRLALAAAELAVVHGPPGTGKTHVVAAYIAAEVARGNRVLVVAPSNVAVDNIAERLAGRAVRFVRAGHPARIIPQVQPFSLDAMLARTEQAALARDVRAELDELEKRIGKTRERCARKTLRAEQRQLRKELRKRERLAVKRLLGKMDVVLATISGAGARVLDIAAETTPFDVVVIDEAAQALEAACWVPLLRAKKAVLAGDPFQLAGTVKSEVAEKRGLKKSILDRVFGEANLKMTVVMLEMQYRMNKVISAWSSREFYGGKLTADEAVRDRLVADLDTCEQEVDDNQNLVNPFIVIDTVGGDCEEDDLSEKLGQDTHVDASGAAKASKSNKGEAQIVSHVVEQFVSCGILKKDIAVISPYSGQVELLRQSLWPKYGRSLEVATIDSFQGREKEVVCMSLVRSNEQGDVGFLNDDRRLNVAITRARRCVVIVCDSETVSSHPLLERMIEYAENFGHYRSAVVDFPDIVGTFSAQRRPKEAIDAKQRSASVVKKQRPGSNRKAGDYAPTKGPRSQKSSRKDTGNQTSVAEDGTSPQDVEQTNGNDVRSRLQSDIAKFMDDELVVERRFPPNLSSFERRIVHELAEGMGVGHETKQIGESRVIKIWKKKVEVEDEAFTESKQSATQAGAENDRAVEGVTVAGAGSYQILATDDEDLDADSSSEKRPAEEDPHKSASHASPHGLTGSQLVALPEGVPTGNGGYKDINTLLRDVSLAREGRQVAPADHPNQAAGGSSDSRPTGKSGRKKRRGKSQKRDSDSDDDFDAVLAKYGTPQHGSKGKPDLVQQIINGQHLPIARTPKVNADAKRRLAAKLSKESEKRSRKPKK